MLGVPQSKMLWREGQSSMQLILGHRISMRSPADQNFGFEVLPLTISRERKRPHARRRIVGEDGTSSDEAEFAWPTAMMEGGSASCVVWCCPLDWRVYKANS